MRHGRLLHIFLLVFAIATNDAVAQFYAVELRALSRSGAQIGTTFDLAVTAGDQLDEIDSLHFSHAGITAELKSLDPLPFSEERQPHYGQFTVSVSADVPAGRYEVRTGGRHGVSNPRAFLVSRLANETPSTISHDAKAPTPLALDTLLHAKATAANVDYFGLTIEDGQSVQIELLAQRVDSRMIGQLTLYDSSGHRLAVSRGADDVDPVMFRAQLPAGDYLLAVHDFTFRGGDEFHYQVVALDPEGDVASTSFVEYDPSVKGQLPRDWGARAFTLLGQGPLMATNEPAQTQTIGLPIDSTYWFPTERSDSVFEFSADEGDTFAIDVVSQRVGEPTDARLIVERMERQESGPPKLHNILNIDDCQSLGDGALNLFARDPAGLFKAPATADYRLTVRDLDQGLMLSLRQRFRLRIQPPDPGFDLVAYRIYPQRDANQTKPLGSKMFRGGGEVIRVLAIRRDGWAGPIKVVAENLPAGVTASEAIIAANQNQTQLTLIASDDAAAVTSPIRLVGHSDDDSITQDVVPATITWGKGGQRDYIRSRIASSLYVSVSDKDLSPISIALGDGKVAEVKQGEAVSLPIKLTRREGGKADCVLRPRDLPAGVTAGEITISADKNEANWELKTTSAAVIGTYSLWAQVETKIKVKQNPQALERTQQYRSYLQTLHDDPAQAANLESIKSAITAADKQVEAVKAAANEQELTVFVPTSNATMRVVQP